MLSIVILYLPSGYTCVDLKLNPNPNSKFQNVSKAQQLIVIQTKANKIHRDRNKMHICLVRVKDVK